MTSSAPFLPVLVAESFQGLRAREERMSHQPSCLGLRVGVVPNSTARSV
jgi:hypothetical protein